MADDGAPALVGLALATQGFRQGAGAVIALIGLALGLGV